MAKRNTCEHMVVSEVWGDMNLEIRGKKEEGKKRCILERHSSLQCGWKVSNAPCCLPGYQTLGEG